MKLRDVTEWRFHISPFGTIKATGASQGRGWLPPPSPSAGSAQGPRLGLAGGISVVTWVQAGHKDQGLARGPKPAGAVVAMPGSLNTSGTHITHPAIIPVRGLVTKVARGCYLSPGLVEHHRCQQ